MDNQIDTIVDSINKAWRDENKRVSYMLQALIYAVRENTASLEGIRKILESYD